MALVADRVRETSTSTGAGNLALAGASTGFQSFNTAFGVGPQFLCTIELQGGSEWETSLCHLSNSTTLVRDRVFKSSAANALVTFSAGTKNVFCSLPGDTARGVINAANILRRQLYR